MSQNPRELLEIIPSSIDETSVDGSKEMKEIKDSPTGSEKSERSDNLKEEVTKEFRSLHKEIRHLRKKMRQQEIWNYITIQELEEQAVRIHGLSRLGKVITNEDLNNIVESFRSKLDARYDGIVKRMKDSRKEEKRGDKREDKKDEKKKKEKEDRKEDKKNRKEDRKEEKKK